MNLVARLRDIPSYAESADNEIKHALFEKLNKFAETKFPEIVQIVARVSEYLNAEGVSILFDSLIDADNLEVAMEIVERFTPHCDAG